MGDTPDWQREYAKLYDLTFGAAERGAPTDAVPDDVDAMAEQAGIAYDRLLRNRLAAAEETLQRVREAAEAMRDDKSDAVIRWAGSRILSVAAGGSPEPEEHAK